MVSREYLELEEPPLILIVDDLPANIEILEGLLSKEGFKVLTALNAKDALRMIEKTQVDMAILDVMMPGMNGYELCKRLKEMAGRKFLPVILVTALDELKDKIAGLEAGADDFFSKPFYTIELITKIRSLLRLRRLQDELDHSEDIILTLAVAIEANDPYTKGHSERVSRISVELARFIRLSEKEVLTVKKAGLLHDIGKIGIRYDTLHKKGPLEKKEFDVIKKHPEIGEEICRPLGSLKQILPTIRHHHERWDGEGFPDGLKGEEIPLMARILFIADSFDAMISERPYRMAASIEEVVRRMEIEMYSGQWDPSLLERFIEMMRRKA